MRLTFRALSGLAPGLRLALAQGRTLARAAAASIDPHYRKMGVREMAVREMAVREMAVREIK
jgi:hypothetical protein